MKFTQQMVTSETIKDESILSADIKNGEIVDADISASAAIAKSKLSIPTIDTVMTKLSTYNFKANSDDAQSIANNTTTIVIFEHEEYDPASLYNVSNGKFVAPCAGIWHFDARIMLAQYNGWEVGEQLDISLMKNNSQIAAGLSHWIEANGTYFFLLHVSADLKLALNDEITIGLWQNSDVAISLHNDQNYNQFCGHWVGDG